ncbi:8-amino-7-oxononanoate synthase [Halocynthiibacter styelae]|uniref:8-amino-7-oxononanoate synthase n=1 Tax=Halocynthiibacter styelae TaxID=2761955 RepID=A0A8J7LL00_9RHOB|nr:8-amino-7-oxononanoate synthase [Paenihalocynthiibacter styelae]MBI1494990.1 8-amino-7-oxononanoate synthase [Paenihalocynthiibacter styelae]
MAGFFHHEAALSQLKTRGRYRSLIPVSGHDFASNDYLGLAASDVLRHAAGDALYRGVPLGAGASRLLRGNHAEHEALEAEAVAFFKTEAALFLNCGFTANTALFSTLPRHDDLILYDTLIHASVHDGMRLSRAQAQAFRHNDVTHAEEIIRDWRSNGGAGRIWLAFETLYSMDGDLAPVADFVALAQAHDLVLVADEAHSGGVFGPGGRGLMAPFEGQADIITLHTCGKAMGVSGALICGARVLIETLINKARGFIFSTAPTPLNAALLRVALQELPTRAERLQKRMAEVADLVETLCALPRPMSQIIPVIIGDDKATMQIAANLQACGFDIRGIRPPTVPRGTSRLRISITLNPSDTALRDMFTALSEELERHAS